MEATTTFYAREARLVYEKANRSEGERVTGTRIGETKDAARHVAHAIGSPMVEHFVCIALDARLRPIGRSTIGIGGLAFCPVDITQIGRFALLAQASAIIVGHNHPSGDPSPSPEDLALTERIVTAMGFLGIKVLDHVIVADGERSYFSFLDAGILRAGAR